MRLLFATHNYPRTAGDPAGAFVARLAHAAARAGHDVHVVAPHAPGIPVVEQEGNVVVHRFRYAPEAMERVGYTGALHQRALASPTTALQVLPFVAAFWRSVTRVTASFRPSVVHAHWWLPAGWIASRGKTPFIVTCHGSDVRLLARPALRMLARPVFARAAAVTTVSRFLADDLRGMLPGLATPVLVAPMPVDVDRFAAGAQAPKAIPPRILYAGNLLESKGVDLLLGAFRLLRDAEVPCQLRILGQGPAEGALHALARRLNVIEEVQWAPFVAQQEMPGEYGASTVTVLPSRGKAEGLGLVLVEALAAGCAVVGTSAGGIPEVALDEHTGLLARGGDAADLARQIGRLLEDPELRARLVARGASHVRATYGDSASRFLELYDEVAGTDT